MPSRAVMLFRLSAFSAVFALAACGQGSVANEIALNDADPALTAALEDPILTDQNLVSQANRNNVRPPELPTRAEYPRVQRASAEAPSSGRGPAPTASCGAAADAICTRGYSARVGSSGGRTLLRFACETRF